jgi:hypothetical protein
MLAVATEIPRRGRAFSGAAAARVVGGCDRLPQPRGYRAVMMVCGRLRVRRGRGGARPSVREYFSCN